MSQKRESFQGIFQVPRSAADASPTPPSPLSLFGTAIEEHFSENDPHFCRADCVDDLLNRLNEREVYIIATATLERLHKPCKAEVQWYRDALETIADGTSSLKPEVLARIALDRMEESR